MLVSNLPGVNNRSFLVVMGVLAVVALLGFGVFKSEGSIALGETAPTEPMPRLDGTGEGSISDYAGSWVLVNVWASWCGPCEDESPDIQEFLEKREDEDFVVVGINSRDATEPARDFIEEYSLTWEMYRDGDGEIADRYAILGQPESFLIDPDGKFAAICHGALTGEQIERSIGKMIDGEQPTLRPAGCSL